MKIIFKISALFFCIAGMHSFAQEKITGTFPPLAGQQIKLQGFDGFATYEIARAEIAADGSFALNYSPKDYGMGYLAATDNKPFIVILAPNEDLKLVGESLAFPETVTINSGKQNRLFEQYASAHPRREQALSAWGYLEKIYTLDSLFALHQVPKLAIAEEKLRIKAEDSLFLAGIDPQMYIHWYLPLRKLVSSVAAIAQYRTEEIPYAIASFRSIDYTDPRLWKSGLLRDVIDSHFWLIENSGRPLDSLFSEMNLSIDIMVENLTTDERKFNEISDYLFRLLEQRSLFPSSEYLALKVLNEVSCTIDSDLAKQLESYRAMKKGNIAPDFPFKEDLLAPGYASISIPQKLSDINSKFTVVVFGATWCPACPKELSQIAALYPKWKSHGVEVVYVSLDEDKKRFRDFSAPFPFISVCDYLKWESPIAQAYHVFATPTIYLLDNKREILLRPGSVQQMDAWVNWFLIEGNM